MEFWIKAAQLILSLSLLIVLHEFGHFIPARLFKTRVEKFYLFFDYKFALFKKKIKGTEWGIGWIPLGGYVKISGMIDESMDTEQMKQEPKPYEFRSKKPWQRLIIMIGGIVVNVIVGFAIYSMVLMVWGRDYIPVGALKDGMAVDPIMEEYGFQDGDQILAVDGVEPFNVLEVSNHLMLRDIRTITVKHQSGVEEILAIPDGIEYTLFKNEVMSPFSPRFATVVDSVIPTGTAYGSELQKGDEIVSVNDLETPFFDQFTAALSENKNQVVDFGVVREGNLTNVQVKVDSLGKIGISPYGAFADLRDNAIENKSYDFFASIPAGFDKAKWTIHDYAAQLKFLFTSTGASKVGGFGSFGKIFAPTWDWHSFWANTALISLILAFMNFLPIPALDGGHIMFLMYEMISGRKPNDKFMEYAQMAGFIFILTLVIYANGADIYRAITDN